MRKAIRFFLVMGLLMLFTGPLVFAEEVNPGGQKSSFLLDTVETVAREESAAALNTA